MKNLYLTLLIVLFGFSATGTAYAATSSAETEQTTRQIEKSRKKAEKEAKKLRKEAEKERERKERAFRDSLSFEMAKAAVEEGRFVIVANQIRGRRGYTVNVNESTNFVLLQDGRATVQFAVERGLGGPNGMGGITVEGSVSGTKITYDKRGNLNYTTFVTGTAISADVRFILPKDGSRCEVTVSSNYNNWRLTFVGELKPYSADIFQGYTIK